MKQFLLSAMLTMSCLVAAGTDSITVSGHFKYLTDRDSVTLRVYEYYHTSYNLNAEKKYSVKVKGNSFVFHIPHKGIPQYVDLILPNGTEDSTRNLTLYYYLLTDGDSIQYSDSIRDRFAGKGAEKWKIRNELDRMHIAYNQKADNMENRSIKKVFSVMDSLVQHQLLVVGQYKEVLPRQTYDLLKADVVGRTIEIKSASLDYMNRYHKNALLDFYESGITDSLLISFKSNDQMLYSPVYWDAILASYKIRCFSHQQIFTIQKCYEYIKETFNCKIAEKAITGLLYLNRSENADISGLTQNTISWMADPNFKSLLSDLLQTRLKGALAKNFELPDPKGKKVRLSDFKGKVVLMDFWYTGCGGCAFIGPKLSHIKKQFLGKDVVFISISADKSEEIWLKSIKQGIYTEQSNINVLAKGLKYDHPVLKKYAVTGFPTLILIDKKGKIMTNPDNPGTDEGKSLISLINEGLM